MKSFLLHVSIFLLPLSLSGQGFSFMSENDAETFLKGILAEFGLTTNDVRIVSSTSTSVSNARADVQNGTRYIYYNPDWMRNMGSTSGKSKWLKMGVLTHEMGHHMKAHTLRGGGTTPALELQADEWAGFAMHKLGLTLDQALTAVRETPNFATSTHPARKDREKAVTKGYRSYQSSTNMDNPPPPTRANLHILIADKLKMKKNIPVGKEPKYWHEGDCPNQAYEGLELGELTIDRSLSKLHYNFFCNRPNAAYDCGGGWHWVGNDSYSSSASADIEYKNGVIYISNIVYDEKNKASSCGNLIHDHLKSMNGKPLNLD